MNNNELQYIEYELRREGKDQDQAVAICISTYENMALVDDEIICDKCGHSWTISKGGDDIYICHECGHDNEMEMMNFESFTNYPEAAKENAKRALAYAEENGWGDCGTPIGKARANQLAKGEPISVDTIKRMYSFLSRHEGDLETSKSFTDGCGYLMYMAWGGKSALGWSRNKLRTLGLLTETKAGVPHYTKDGKLYEGPTHKVGDRLMTGSVHDEYSEYLYHKEELAEPSITSSYPGEVTSGSIAPALK